MPKDVDHDKRREELLEAIWRVVARDGLEHATIRGMAAETGWSAGSLAHYFADKDDILASALRLAYARAEARREVRLAGLSGLAALRELVLDNLPLDEERLLETKFLMNYWSRAIRDPDGVPRPSRHGPWVIDRLTTLIRQGQEAGEIVTDRAAEDVAECLLALIDGFSLHGLLDPDRLGTDRQVALIDDELARISTKRAAPTAGTCARTARRTHA